MCHARASRPQAIIRIIPVPTTSYDYLSEEMTVVNFRVISYQMRSYDSTVEKAFTRTCLAARLLSQPPPWK